MRNSVIAVLAAIAAIGMPALFAAPANAGSGPPVVGCTTGSSCMIELQGLVQSSGSTGGSNGVVAKPPPCIGVPAGNAHAGSAAIISFYGTTVPVPAPTTASPSATALPSASASVSGTASPTATASATPTPTPSTAGPTLTPVQQQILNQAKQLVNSDPMTPGEWYQVDANPYAPSAASQVCASLPLYVWSNTGLLPEIRGLNIPPRTLAAIAYSELFTPQLVSLQLNPHGVSDTNLPTFVNVTIRSPGFNLLALTAAGHPYVWATAELNGRAATVYAVTTGMDITTDSPNAQPWDVSQCSVAQPPSADDKHAGDLMLGSRDVASAGDFGAGSAIDCGMTYNGPGRFHLTVRVGWTACWAPGQAVAAGPPPNCNPNFDGAGGLQPRSRTVTVHVREIQSVNG